MAKTVHTTNVPNTFIRVAEDCPARTGEEPPLHAGKATVARLQYEMIAKAPYKFTSDDVVFATSAPGRQLDAKATKEKRSLARNEFFSRGQACLRASGLGKRFGWAFTPTPKGASHSMRSTASDTRRWRAIQELPRPARCERSAARILASADPISTLHGVVFSICVTDAVAEFSPCGRRWREAPDEGSLSAETTPHPSAMLRIASTLSHKGPVA